MTGFVPESPIFSSLQFFRLLDPPTATQCNKEAESTAGMGTAARMTRVRAAAKNAYI